MTEATTPTPPARPGRKPGRKPKAPPPEVEAALPVEQPTATHLVANGKLLIDRMREELDALCANPVNQYLSLGVRSLPGQLQVFQVDFTNPWAVFYFEPWFYCNTYSLFNGSLRPLVRDMGSPLLKEFMEKYA